MVITYENSTDNFVIPNPIITKANLGSVTINAENVQEEYNNPVFTITPPTSTPLQINGPADTWIVNLLRVTRQYSIQGYVDAESRAMLRAIFLSGDLKNNPCTLSWDNIEGGSISGVIEKLTIKRPANEEQSEWGVDLTFTRGVAK